MRAFNSYYMSPILCWWYFRMFYISQGKLVYQSNGFSETLQNTPIMGKSMISIDFR